MNIEPGQYIKLFREPGRVLGVFTDNSGRTAVQIMFVKNIFQYNRPELILIDDNSEIEPASKEDIELAIAQHLRRVRLQIKEHFSDV